MLCVCLPDCRLASASWPVCCVWLKKCGRLQKQTSLKPSWRFWKRWLWDAVTTLFTKYFCSIFTRLHETLNLTTVLLLKVSLSTMKWMRHQILSCKVCVHCFASDKIIPSQNLEQMWSYSWPLSGTERNVFKVTYLLLANMDTVLQFKFSQFYRKKSLRGILQQYLCCAYLVLFFFKTLYILKCMLWMVLYLCSPDLQNTKNLLGPSLIHLVQLTRTVSQKPIHLIWNKL